MPNAHDGIQGEAQPHRSAHLLWQRLSVKTVSTYRARVMEKLKLGSNSDLTYYAMKNGLIQ